MVPGPPPGAGRSGNQQVLTGSKSVLREMAFG